MNNGNGRKAIVIAVPPEVVDEADPAAIVAEQTRFLLRELQALLVDEGLVDTDDVVIVAARIAYDEYLQFILGSGIWSYASIATRNRGSSACS